MTRNLIELCEGYLAYVRSGFKQKEGEVLACHLMESGFMAHAEALSNFLGSGEGLFSSGRHVVGMSAYYISTTVPKSTDNGVVWFDPIGLDFLIRTESNPLGTGAGVTVWICTQPVTLWQYLVFLKLAIFSIRDDGFLEVDDLLNGRFFGDADADIVGNVYHDEAKAYVAWQGKQLVSHFDLKTALIQLPYSTFEAMLPAGLSVWNGSIGREDKRLVVNASKLESMNEEARKNIAKSDSSSIFIGECEEWYRAPEIGILPCVIDSVGLQRTLTSDREVGERIVLHNLISCVA